MTDITKVDASVAIWDAFKFPKNKASVFQVSLNKSEVTYIQKWLLIHIQMCDLYLRMCIYLSMNVIWVNLSTNMSKYLLGAKQCSKYR